MHGVLALLALGAGCLPAQALAQADAGTVTESATLRLKQGTQLREVLPEAVRPELPTFVSGDQIESQTDAVTVIEGSAELRRHDTVIKADRLEYDQRSGDARGTGHVLINRQGDRFTGPDVQLNVNTDKGYFTEPEFTLLRNEGQGDASRIDFVSKDTTVAHNARYSTCPRTPGERWMPDWLVRATRIELDNVEEVGYASGGVLEFKGVPIMAAPYFSFPTSDKRKTGVLPPSINFDSQSGVELMVPYYLNLAPNYDVTLYPSVMSKRGVDLAGEARYLAPTFSSRLRAAYMPSDKLRDRDRWAYALAHNQRLGESLGAWGPIGLRLNLNRVSDDNYWSDFPRSSTIQLTTSRLLHSDAVLGWGHGPWSASVGAYKWQTLQNAGSPITPPYDRLPALGVNYSRINQSLFGSDGWDFTVQTNFTRFQRSVAAASGTVKVGGDRALAIADLTHRWEAPGWFVQPRARLHTTQYQFDGAAGASTNLSRAVPTASLDSGLVFEKPATFWGREYVQTLEPRAFFTWTPFRDQSGLPNFDSASRDFSLASMYTENVFSGNDRISDTRAVTLGVSSRLINPDTGAEVVRLGVAQRYLLEDQNVTLPGGKPVTERLSNILLSGRVQWDPLWSFDSTLQYNPKSRESVRTTVGGRYTPGPYRVLSAAYRIQRGVSEQIDLGWQWPLSALWGDAPARVPGRALGPGQWYSVGRMNYSMPDRKIVDLIAGFEYDAGCWLGRVVLTRLQQTTTKANQSILFQLEFSGFSKVGASSLQTLQANVPKYQYLREEISSPSRFENYD